jgi:co-chaperonin GroES (HSP10)
MSLDKIQASGHIVMVIRDIPESEKDGVIIPPSVQKKPNTGKVLSVGELVEDKSIVKGKTAIFSRQVGTEIVIFDTAITILNAQHEQVLGTY